MPHLEACRIAVPSGPARWLLIEDFATTGLDGSVEIERKDEGQFRGFWRRFGSSNKDARRGSYGGRWGLGKLVFSSSSSIKTLIGFTRRTSSPATCLMGQAILRNHMINGLEKDSVGFWCRDGSKGLPLIQEASCLEFAELLGLERRDETGLSLAIPYVLPEIDSRHLIAAVVKNYYFPVMTGRLSVTVDDLLISADTFDQVSTDIGGDAISASMLSFVRQLQSLRANEPDFVVPANWQKCAITAELLGANATTSLRTRFQGGEMLFIRAPLLITSKADQQPIPTHIDLFLRPTQPGERTQTLVVRGSITVPTEGKKAHLPDCHAALVADHPAISQMLGDAENPAHTQWNERAEKLKSNWVSPHLALRRVRAVLHELHAVIVDRIERDDPTALVDFFSVPKKRDVTTPSGARTTAPDLASLKTSPKPFRIERRKGGFKLLPSADLGPDSLPLRIRIRCAYDVLNGNPFKRFSDQDFNFFMAQLTVVKHNAECWPTDTNQIDIEARVADFRVEIAGFDVNRDLVVEAQI